MVCFNSFNCLGQPLFTSLTWTPSFLTSQVALVLKNPPDNVGDRFDPWVGKISWRRTWQPTLLFLPGEFHGQRNLVGYSPWIAKNQTWLSWLSTLTQTRALDMISSPPLVVKWKLSLLTYTDSDPAWPHRYLPLTALPPPTNLHEAKGSDHRSTIFISASYFNVNLKRCQGWGRDVWLTMNLLIPFLNS